MEKPRFPVVLVLLVAFFGFIAVTEKTPWISIVAGTGAFFIAAAAIYQSIPRTPTDQGSVDELDDEPDDEPPR